MLFYLLGVQWRRHRYRDGFHSFPVSSTGGVAAEQACLSASCRWWSYQKRFPPQPSPADPHKHPKRKTSFILQFILSSFFLSANSSTRLGSPTFLLPLLRAPLQCKWAAKVILTLSSGSEVDLASSPFSSFCGFQTASGPPPPPYLFLILLIQPPVLR